MQNFKKLLHKAFRITGRDFAPYTYEYFYSLRRTKIIEGNNINLVVDVGAHDGKYGNELRNDGYHGRILSFEPLEGPFKELQWKAEGDSLWECEQVALGDSIGEEEINVSGHLTSSSILPITKSHINAYPSSETVDTEIIKISTLDAFRESYINKNDKIFMKVDVQGYEQHVLDGARNTIKDIRILEMELSLEKMYEGGPIITEMLDILKNTGFNLVALNSVFSDPVSGYMLQADGIFVNEKLES